METKESKLIREMCEVAVVLKRARTEKALELFYRKEHIDKELRKLIVQYGPQNPACFQVFRLFKEYEEHYISFVRGIAQ